MILLLYRDLTREYRRTVLSVAAVAAALVLVLALEGFKTGLVQQVRAYQEHLAADLVAIPSGPPNLLTLRLGLPADAAARLAAVHGVDSVAPAIGYPAIFTRGAMRTPVYVIGYQEAGGPWRLAAGRLPRAPGEAVLDRGLAKRNGISLGGRVELLGAGFTVAGLSSGTASMFGSYVFLTLEDAVALRAGGDGAATATVAPNLLIVRLVPGTDARAVGEAVQATLPGAQLLAPADLARNDAALAQDLLGSVMNLLVGVAYVVGTLVIGLVLYGSALERSRQHGIVKALGASNRTLYGALVVQTAVITAAAFLLAAAAAQGLASLVGEVAPQYHIATGEADVLGRAAAGAGAMALFAALVPVRQIANAEPAVVFRS